jgi:hypothetical protein
VDSKVVAPSGVNWLCRMPYEKMIQIVDILGIWSAQATTTGSRLQSRLVGGVSTLQLVRVRLIINRSCKIKLAVVLPRLRRCILRSLIWRLLRDLT